LRPPVDRLRLLLPLPLRLLLLRPPLLRLLPELRLLPLLLRPLLERELRSSACPLLRLVVDPPRPDGSFPVSSSWFARRLATFPPCSSSELLPS
jgi:hypothetical protein